MDFDREAVLASFIAEAHEGLDLMEQSLLAMESSSAGPELLNDIFRVAHTTKGNAIALELDELAGFAHSTEDLLDALRERKTEISADEISLLLKAVDELRTLVSKSADGIQRLSPTQRELEKQIAAEVSRLSQRVDVSEAQGNTSVAEKTKTVPSGNVRTLRADIDKLDGMLNLTGEIVIAQGHLRRLIDSVEKVQPELGRKIREVQGEAERLFRCLQEEVMAVRMVPIGAMLRQTFRTVRDLANSHSKLARVEISGGDVEVDTAVLEQLKDALLHMIRNSVDHGIEMPPVRKSRGKNPCGVIKVSAAQISSNVVVSLQDDGAGLNRANILRKAREIGLFVNTHPSDAELYQVLFRPGFSTNEAVTELSGRGVGLDVVRRNIEALRGSVEVASEEGKGTNITIRLPLTIAIMDGLSVMAGDGTYVVPQEYVIECTDLVAAEQDSGCRGVLNLRGNALPYVRLREVFRQQWASTTRENVVVVKVGEMQAGIVVDQLLGGMQAVIKPLDRLFRGISGLAGSTILGDGRVGLIIDVPGLLQGIMQQGLQPQAG
jgi:two-component system, chemotaxis family, sensor kinase CheA